MPQCRCAANIKVFDINQTIAAVRALSCSCGGGVGRANPAVRAHRLMRSAIIGLTDVVRDLPVTIGQRSLTDSYRAGKQSACLLLESGC